MGRVMVEGRPLSTDRLSEIREVALREGMRLARKMFAKRGNHSEAHLSETELAAMLCVAWEGGHMAALGYVQTTRGDPDPAYRHPEGECQTPSCSCHARAARGDAQVHGAPWCPKCGSSLVQKSVRLPAGSWTCDACGAVWQTKKEVR